MKNSQAFAYSFNGEKTVAQDLDTEHLPTILPIHELIGLFANEISETVNYDSFEYENAQKGIHVFHGSVKLHKCHYKIKDSGVELGQITLTRKSPFLEEEMIFVERALGALSIHLDNAIVHQSELKQEHLDAHEDEAQLSRIE